MNASHNENHTRRVRIAVDPPGQLPVRLADALRGLYGVELGPPSEDAAAEIRLPGCSARPVDGRPCLDASAARPASAGSRTATIELTDRGDVPRPFRGRALEDAWIPEGTEAVTGGRVLAHADRRVLWTRTGAHDRVAVCPALAADETLPDAFRPGRFLAQLALLAFVERLVPSSPAGDGLPASIVIDDPNLHRPRYGALDFEAIARAARAVRLHAAMAMIPLDAWYAHRRAVETFRRAPDALSLLVHGNNHVSRELARPLSDGAAVAQLAQALARISRFERRTGIPVSRTMAAPHGACSRETVRRLARVGFTALTISRPRPWADDEKGASEGSVEALSGARPVEIADGLPLVLRTHVDRFDMLPFRAFLGQPLVVYGHHWDWPAGADDLARTAEEVARVTDVDWVAMHRIQRDGARVTRNGSLALVALDARAGRIPLPDGVDAMCVDGARLDRRDAVVVDGEHVQPDTPLPVTAGSAPTFELVALDAPAPGSVGRPRTPPWPVLRRVLTESRDRLPNRARGRAGR